MESKFSRRRMLSAGTGVSALALTAAWTNRVNADEDNGARADDNGRRLNRLVVSPAGPSDGGDFGPHTPGTRTSGLQEAFDAAKSQRKDLYICGGSWTEGKNQPVVYFLSTTLQVPWMQDFRMDSGHAVLQYTPKTGDAIEIDSQMSCSYRFGLVASNSNGAVVRLAPKTAGPDRFKVITSSDFHFNALVGGGGAWPGGESYNSNLDQGIRRIGTGLWIDGRPGSIDANTIDVTEIVGCERGLLVDAASSNNWIRATNIHLCHEHLVVGTSGDDRPRNNYISAYLNSEGIANAVGLRLAAQFNRLDLTIGRMGMSRDVIFEPAASFNLVSGLSFSHGITNRAKEPTNRLISIDHRSANLQSPAIPGSGEWCRNDSLTAVEVRIVDPGRVTQWSERCSGTELTFAETLASGQSFVLNPGDSISITYEQPPSWHWKPIG